MKFKLKCINPDINCNLLYGEIYTLEDFVQRGNETYFIVRKQRSKRDVDGLWHPERFEKVE